MPPLSVEFDFVQKQSLGRRGYARFFSIPRIDDFFERVIGSAFFFELQKRAAERAHHLLQKRVRFYFKHDKGSARKRALAKKMSAFDIAFCRKTCIPRSGKRRAVELA